MRFIATVFLFVLLAKCRAEEVIEIHCNVTQNGNQVTYLVSDGSRPSDFDLSECDYSWAAENGSVLANSADQIPPGTNHNTLVTTECFEKVVLKQQCTSKTTQLLTEFKSVCTTTCAEKSRIHGKDEGSTVWTTKDKIGAGVGAALGGLVLLGLIVLYKFQNQIRSVFSCRPSKRCMLFRRAPIKDPDLLAVVVKP